MPFFAGLILFFVIRITMRRMRGREMMRAFSRMNSIPEIPESTEINNILCLALAYLARYPNIQSRLRDEIDRKVGRSRLARLEEQARMPYMEAFVHEILRHSGAAAGFVAPRTTSRSIQLEGFSLPSGTTVFANMWFILNDPNHWTDPQVFRPERFIDDKGCFRKDERCLLSIAGGPSCPAQHMVLSIITLFLAGLIQNFAFETSYCQPLLHGNIFPGNVGRVMRGIRVTNRI